MGLCFIENAFGDGILYNKEGHAINDVPKIFIDTDILRDDGLIVVKRSALDRLNITKWC